MGGGVPCALAKRVLSVSNHSRKKHARAPGVIVTTVLFMEETASEVVCGGEKLREVSVAQLRCFEIHCNVFRNMLKFSEFS
jgi:hypothetical protein